MLTAYAFLCAVTAADCEHEAKFKMKIGEGNTPFACFQDGFAGAARALVTPEEGQRLVVKCERTRPPED